MAVRPRRPEPGRQADGHSGRVRQCLRRDHSRSPSSVGFAILAGHRPCHLTWPRLWPAAAAVPDPCPAARCTSCHVRGAAARPTPGGCASDRRAEASRTPDPGRKAAPVTSMAWCTGQRPSGRRSFRKQRTVNPPIVPARHNFLYSSSRPACGGPPTASVLGRHALTTGGENLGRQRLGRGRRGISRR